MHKRDSTAEYTLLHHSACKIISHILVNCNGSYQNLPPYNQSEHRVNGIDQLDLPQHLKDLLHGYVGPIHEELWCWYHRKHGSGHPVTAGGPVFTWRGTLDMVETARRVVDDESQRVMARFTLACTYGFTDSILKLKSLLTLSHIRMFNKHTYYGYRFAKAWFDYEDKLASCGDGEESPRALYEKKVYEVTKIALCMNNDIVFQSLDLMPEEKARKLIGKYFEGLLDKPYLVFPPKSYHRLFTKLSPDQQNNLLDLYSYNILMKLLKWPYQGRFLEVSQSVVGNLDGIQYKRVWNEILCNIDSKNYDYAPLLHSFWKLGVDRKNEFFREPTPDDQRLINLVRAVLVRHRYPDIIDEVKDDTIVSTLQILEIS